MSEDEPTKADDDLVLVGRSVRNLRQLASEINRLHGLIADAGLSVIEYAAEIGEMLTEAKKAWGKHGKWFDWFEGALPRHL
jgi:hypothetical protein